MADQGGKLCHLARFQSFNLLGTIMIGLSALSVSLGIFTGSTLIKAVRLLIDAGLGRRLPIIYKYIVYLCYHWRTRTSDPCECNLTSHVKVCIRFKQVRVAPQTGAIM